MNEYKDKICIVTGGGGLIGRQVVKLLRGLKANTISVGLDNPVKYPKFISCDLTSKEHCINILRGADYVFHLAGIKASPDITNRKPATMSITPLTINTNVLDACRINKIKNVLFTSSIGAYAEDSILKEENAYVRDPMDFYPGMVKRMAEFQIQAYKKEFGLKYKVVRVANCYGPGDNFDTNNAMFIPSLIAKVVRGDDPVEIWGDGSTIRDLVYSKDVAYGILKVMDSDVEGVVNLGSGNGYSVKDVVLTLNSIRPFNYQFNPSKPSGVPIRILDTSKAKSLGFVALTSLEKGFKETYEWFLSHQEEYKKRKNYFKDG